MEDTLKKQFGKRIQTFRKETGLSQEKFALKIEMDRTYYASVESGKRNVSICSLLFQFFISGGGSSP